MANHAYSDVQVARRNAKGRNKPRNAEKTLGDIMDVAEALFAKYGYEGTSLRQVAVGVHMSQPNFYNYFSSKEKLYESVLARSLLPLMALINDGIAKTSSNESIQLNDDIAYQVIDAFVELLAKNRNLAGLIYQESIKGSETVTRLSIGMLEGILEQSTLGLSESNTGAWPKDQIPFLVVAWFNLIFGYFASASLMKGVLPSSSDPASKKALQTQRLFLRSVWNKLMRS
jgi:AcrR family transcriptional regulator